MIDPAAVTARVTSSHASTAVPGRTATLLPNGSWLLLGGQGEAGPLGVALVRPPGSSQTAPLSSALNVPRAWHTATLLPDGTVLVLGGLGASGNVIGTVELFDPATSAFRLVNSAGPTPRAYHTATLLTDGTVLIAGGMASDGTVLRSAEIWDPQTKTTTPVPAELTAPRRSQLATLLPDGKVLLWGGTSENGELLKNGDLYDKETSSLTPVDTPPSETQAANAGPSLAASIPEDGAQNVAVSSLIALRFSEPLQVQTVNVGTAVLQGPEGELTAKVVPAEGGMLAFLTPLGPLLPDTTYTLSLNGLADSASRTLPSTQIAFTTAGPAAPFDDETWTPSGSSWRTGRPESTWQKLPPLQAPPGVTAIAGQVLKLNGEPLSNVTLQVDNYLTQSDSTGRFLLTLGNGMSGHCVLVIRGATADRPGKKYGLFEYGMNIGPGITVVLPFTIWMPLLDIGHAVIIPSPTKTETVITTPLLPGLELRIPAQTVIYDHDGRIAREISITPIPLDRTPFPLPNVEVPIYFTIQPGGAELKILDPKGPKGARLIYPNTYKSPPGTIYNFWNYEADDQGWYIYGLGTVAPDRVHIVPDPGVVIYEFSGAMVGTVGAPTTGPPPGNSNGTGGEPVDLATGLFVYRHTDLALPDVIPLALTRTYRPNDPVSRGFGIGTTHPYDIFIVIAGGGVDLIVPDGGRIHFSGGVCTSSPTSFFGATFGAGAGVWVIKKKDGTVLNFPVSDEATRWQQEAIIGYQDRYGNALTFTRDSSSNLTKIASPNGRYIQFTLDAGGRIIQATDNIGRIVKYAYDGSGRLTTVTDANGGVTTYTYDGSSNMTQIKDPRGITYLTNQFDANNRVSKQTQADGSTFQFSYTLDGAGNVTQTTLTDPRKNIRQVAFNSNGYTTSDTLAVDTSQQQTTTFSRDSSSNLISNIVDPLKRQTSYTYDALGNVTSITRLSGTPGAVTTSFTYDPTFSQPESITDPLTHTTNFTYDSVGNLTTLSDPLTHQWTFTYSSQGQPLTATDPLLNKTTFSYNSGDLVSVTDPLLRVTNLGRDGAGRLVWFQEPAGTVTFYGYDALDDLTSTIDPLGNITSFAYDADRNLISLTDALKHATNYKYDRLDRLEARQDPLGNSESYMYDPNGNIASLTDRKGQKTIFTYDPLNRRTKATYADGSSSTYTYDAGNRLTKAVDSISGMIMRGYDGLDRLTSETTPQGKVTYAYDKASRRTALTVAGQPAIGYFYDHANRLTKITQGTSTFSLSYDKANRRIALTLANGVTTNYSYDKASELTGLTYTRGPSALGNLTYTYDTDGRRTSIGGTYARTGLPAAVASASFSADNQLTQWGLSSLTYDLNGNLTNDGINTYTWNARNQLASINAGTTASFQYDGFGRRQTKTISGASTSFLYDGINAVQELNGATVEANLVTGLAVDEIYSRTGSADARYFLSDALGSTLALTDSTGAAQTQYTYEPFGHTTLSGTSSGSSYEYTGRENDATGLYYYRARYYSPAVQRFISEDPIRFFGGAPDLYQYAFDSPLILRDPAGKDPGGPNPPDPNPPDPNPPDPLTVNCSDSTPNVPFRPPPFRPPPFPVGPPTWEPPGLNLPPPPPTRPVIGRPYHGSGRTGPTWEEFLHQLECLPPEHCTCNGNVIDDLGAEGEGTSYAP